MRKKQIDLLGKEIPDYKVKQIEDKIKNKLKTPLFSEDELKSFSNLIKQEKDLLNLSKASIVKELWKMKLFEEAEKKQERTKIIDKFVKLVNQLQELKEDKDYLRVITKLLDSNKILYQFIIEESTNLYNQFRRFLSFLSLLVFLSQDIVNSTQHAVEHASSLVAGPFKSNDINQYYKEEEERIISDITLNIFDNNLIYNVYSDNKKYYFPLDFDTIKNRGRYFKLKNKYVLKSDHPYVIKRNFIKKLPYFFKKILLEHENRVEFDNNGMVIRLALGWLSLTHLPNELEHFPNLVYLYLGNNQLWEIPNSIGKLKSLENLNLSFNPIATLPESIGNLRRLKYLSMSRCSKLKTLPESLSNLTNLERLDLTCSNLEVVPEALRKLLGRGVPIDLNRNNILIKPLKVKELKLLAKKIKVEKNIQTPYVIHKGIIYFAKPDSNEKYSLNLSNKEITDLDEVKGLKKLINLKSLVLRHNKISEIKYLDSFKKLKVLILGNNQIQTIRGLGNLTNLENLDLSVNSIYEISGLERLTNLRILSLGNNNIKEIKGLENLVNLRTLDLTGNNIREVKVLENLSNLRKIYFSRPRSKKPSELNKILREFNTDAKKYVEYCQEKITPWSELEKLDDFTDYVRINKKKYQIRNSILNLKGVGINNITEIKGLENNPHIEQLILYQNNLSKIKGLDHLTNLKFLDLGRNKIVKIENLDSLITLENLNLEFNQISKIEGLVLLKNLKKLNLGGNKILKIENLDKLKEITSLNLQINKISKIEGLKELTKLKTLDLNYNYSITEIEGLENLRSLIKLSLWGNKIPSNEIDELEGYYNYKLGLVKNPQKFVEHCIRQDKL